MKRIFKSIALILILAIICIAMSGCQALDDIRQSRITLTEAGNILYGNHEYILLPECEYLSPNFDYYSSLLYLAEEDVPLLLTSIFSTEHSVSTDEKFIGADYYGDSPRYYCRDDIYEDIIKRINDGFKPDGYCYEYYNYESGSDMLYQLTEAECKDIQTVLREVSPTLLPDIANINYDTFVALEACSADLLFRNFAYNIYELDGKYYISAISGEQYMIYNVPEELNDSFKNILKCVTAEEYEFFEE